jgi:C1A family cysteine protease
MAQQPPFCVSAFRRHTDFVIEADVSKFVPQGMGWIPDLPDARDYTYRHNKVLHLLRRLKRSRRKTLPNQVDLRRDDEGEYFTPPEDQGPLNCSSACAVLGLAEYFERRVRGRTFESSKLFLYKVTRNRLQKRLRVMGDTGADLRTTLKVLVQFGVPPEEHWPYDIDNFDEEPSAFLYSLATPFRDVCYFRLDEPNCDGAKTWEVVKSFLAAGFPVAFGFPVPTSLTADANVPYRPDLDSIRGGQAAVAVGYKTNHFGRGQHALLIRSSWGGHWGDNGNGWLPIAFLRSQLTKDYWTLVSDQWLDSRELSRPSIIDSAGKTSRKS